MTSRIKLIGAVSSLAMLAIGGARLTAPSWFAGAAPVVQAPSSSDYVHSADYGVSFGSGYRADVMVDTAEKGIELAWTYNPTSAPGEAAVKDVTSDRYSTRYWPTACIVLSPYEWAVAGTTSTGATVIEKWTMSSERGGLAAPSVLQSIDPQTGGVGEYSWTLPQREDIREVFRHAPSEATTVRFMVASKARDSLLVSFAEDASLWRVSLAAGGTEPVLVATSSPSAAIHTVPELTTQFNVIWAMEHSDYGDVYILAQAQEDPFVALALVDTDGDQLPESITVLDEAQWGAGSLHDDAKVTKRWR